MCPACETLNLPDSKFCNECGTALLGQSKVQSPESKQVQNLKPVLPAPVPQAQVSVVEGSKSKSQKSENPNPNFQIPDHESEAEACFLKAIDISRKQQAKSLELRAVMSLVRLRQQQVQDHATRNTQHEVRNRLNEAHQMLSEIYNWFTEGFDTKDLQEAKTLLGELGR